MKDFEFNVMYLCERLFCTSEDVKFDSRVVLLYTPLRAEHHTACRLDVMALTALKCVCSLRQEFVQQRVNLAVVYYYQ